MADKQVEYSKCCKRVAPLVVANVEIYTYNRLSHVIRICEHCRESSMGRLEEARRCAAESDAHWERSGRSPNTRVEWVDVKGARDV